MSGEKNATAPARRRRSGEEVRALLLEAATGVFAEKGYAEATTREIIARAGVSDQSLFSHFESKRGLFEAAIVEPIASFLTSYTAEWGARSAAADDPGLMFDQYVVGLYDLVRVNRRLLLALEGDLLSQPAVHACLDDLERFARAVADRHGLSFDTAIAVRSIFLLVTSVALRQEELLPGRLSDEVAAELSAMFRFGYLGRGHTQGQ